MFLGYVDRIDRGFVAGWAANTEPTDTITQIIVYIDGRRYAQVRCDSPRPDVRPALPEGVEAHGFRHTIVPPLPADVDHRVSVRFARTGALLRNGEKLLPSGRQGRMSPVLVTAAPRAGATLVMSRLTQSPDIVVSNGSPFQVRMLSYYAAAYRVLTAPADPLRSTHPDNVVGSGFFVGSNPFSDGRFLSAFDDPSSAADFFEGFAKREIGETFQKLIMEYYLRIRDTQDRPDARYFAERNADMTMAAAKFAEYAIGGVRHLVVVRDPRDLLCSLGAWTRDPFPKLFREVTNACRALTELRSDTSSRKAFIKYEDVVARQDRFYLAMSEFLDASMPVSVNDTAERATFVQQATSASPDASVGRWKRELSPDQVARCNTAWRDFLTLFEYDGAVQRA
jgi:hypothetical protein